MWATTVFNLNPVSQAVKWASLAPLLLLAQQVLAGPINGGVENIDQNTPLDNYTLSNAATLNANAATTREITAGG